MYEFGGCGLSLPAGGGGGEVVSWCAEGSWWTEAVEGLLWKIWAWVWCVFLAISDSLSSS